MATKRGLVSLPLRATARPPFRPLVSPCAFSSQASSPVQPSPLLLYSMATGVHKGVYHLRPLWGFMVRPEDGQVSRS